jgi:hypothetical protein
MHCNNLSLGSPPEQVSPEERAMRLVSLLTGLVSVLGACIALPALADEEALKDKKARAAQASNERRTDPLGVRASVKSERRGRVRYTFAPPKH